MQVAQPAQAGADSATLQRYAEATWASFVAMTDADSGLPTDLLHADGRRDMLTSTARSSHPSCRRSTTAGSQRG